MDDSPEIKHLEGTEDRLVGDSSLEPEEQRHEAEEDEGWSVEEPDSGDCSDGNDKFKVVRRDQLPLLLYLHPLLHRGGLLVAVLDEVLEVDGLVGPLNGVRHHVEQQGGERQLYGV